MNKLLLLFFICLFYGCNSQPSASFELNTQLVGVKGLYMPNKAYYRIFFSVFEEKEQEYLSILAMPEKGEEDFIKVYVYNIETTSLIKTVHFSPLWNKKLNVANFSMSSMDSIWVHFANHTFAQDSSLVLFDGNGKEIYYVDMNQLPVTTQKYVESTQNPDAYTLFLDYEHAQEIPIINGNLITPFYRAFIPQAAPAPEYVWGEYSLKEQKYSDYEDFRLPKYLLENPWAREYMHPRLNISLEGEPLITFGNTPTIWKREKGFTQEINTVQPTLLEKIHPLRVDKRNRPEHQEFYEPDAGGYARLLTDKQNKQYLWILALPIESYGLDPYYEAQGMDMPKTGVILLDSAFHTLGETISANSMVFENVLVCKQGLILYDFASDKEYYERGGKDSIFIKLIRFKVDSTRFVKPSTKVVKKNNILEYLQTYYPQSLKAQKSVVIVSAVDLVCKNCLHKLMYRLGNKESATAYPNVYLNLLLEDGMSSKEYKKENSISSTNVLIDDSGGYKDFMYRNLNSFVYFMQDGKIIDKVAITPFNETSILQEVSEYVNGK